MFLPISASCGSGKIPVVLFDEYDSSLADLERGWLKYLIGPMLDAFYLHNGTKRYFRKSVYYFAGGVYHNIKPVERGTFAAISKPPQCGPHCQQHRKTNPNPADPDLDRLLRLSKAPDFVSRLHAHVTIGAVNFNPDGLLIFDKQTSFRDRRQAQIDSISAYVRRAVLLRNIFDRQKLVSAEGEIHPSDVGEQLLEPVLFKNDNNYGSRGMENGALSTTRFRSARSTSPLSGNRAAENVMDFMKPWIWQPLAGAGIISAIYMSL